MRRKWLWLGAIAAALMLARIGPRGIEAQGPRAAPIDAPRELRRGIEALERGRLAEAESAFANLAASEAEEAAEGRARLVEVLWAQGRLDEVRTHVEARWRRAIEKDGAEAAELLNFELALTLNPLPIDRLNADLDRLAARAGDDDRVWLGRANLATRAGRLVEAAGWLERCAARRPDNPAVWRARLDWARAADRPDVARKALDHLRTSDFEPDQVAMLGAWFAGHHGDSQAERRELEAAIAAVPGRTEALGRLAELADRAGRHVEAGRWRRRKDAMDATFQRFRNLYRDGGLNHDPRALAELAAALGRRFEADALRATAGDQPTIVPRVTSGPTLAARLAADLGPIATPTPVNAGSRPRFRDDARVAGLVFQHDPGASPFHQVPEAMSGGVALLDFDGDGRLDVYAVQGGPFPPDLSEGSGDRLFRNRGDGTFEDVTRKSGIAGLGGGYGHGVAVGDVDNDGHPDLFITRWRAYVLYHNKGDGTFEDWTEKAGLGGDRDWPTSAAFADLDNDGDLDLYACHYLRWDADRPVPCRSPTTGNLIPCDPRKFDSWPDHVFRNDAGRFVDMTVEAGLNDADGRGLGVVAADLDDDGRVDLVVANDTSANFFYRNRGGFRFEEVAHASGVAGNAQGGYQAGMGVASGDLDGDGKPDLAVTNFHGESTTFFQNLGAGLFADRTAEVGLAAPSRYLLGFGISLLDADNDGRLDLLTANGHVADERPEIAYAMPAQLLIGAADGRLHDVSKEAGPPFRRAHLGRGLATGDLDNDGRVDAVLLAQGEPLVYLHNQTNGGRSITFELQGRRSNRDGVGARVAIVACGRRQTAWRVGGGSYQSASDGRLRFGLGSADRVESVEVRWPSGQSDRFDGLAAGRGYRLIEGDPSSRPLAGWGPFP